MKFYSEVTKSFYDSVESCEEAEKEYNKALDEKKEKEKKKKFRYVCPKCNKEFIIKSEIPNIMCGDCNEVFRITEEV